MAFRKAYANARPGETLWFEGQPYAVPAAPGFLAPEQQVQQYFQPPPGGWTGGVDPNVFAAQDQMQGVIPSTNDLARMSGPEYQGKESDYYAKNFFRDIPSGRFSPDSRNMGLMQLPNGDWVPDPSTDPSGQSIPFDDPSIAGTSIPFPEQSQREMAMAGYRVGHEPPRSFEHMYNAPSSVTGMYGPGQDTGSPPGLLSEPMVDRDWIDNPTPTQQPLLASNSGVDKSGTTDRSGWEKNKVMWDLIRMGLGSDDSWTPGFEYE